MGNNQTKQPARMFRTVPCQDDLQCQNIDANKSTAHNIVTVCPEAKCVEGGCVCGTKCEKDPYTGMCCTSVEKKVINGQMNTFCIEGPNKEEGYCNLGFY